MKAISPIRTRRSSTITSSRLAIAGRAGSGLHAGDGRSAYAIGWQGSPGRRRRRKPEMVLGRTPGRKTLPFRKTRRSRPDIYAYQILRPLPPRGRKSDGSGFRKSCHRVPRQLGLGRHGEFLAGSDPGAVFLQQGVFYVYPERQSGRPIPGGPPDQSEGGASRTRMRAPTGAVAAIRSCTPPASRTTTAYGRRAASFRRSTRSPRRSKKGHGRPGRLFLGHARAAGRWKLALPLMEAAGMPMPTPS